MEKLQRKIVSSDELSEGKGLSWPGNTGSFFWLSCCGFAIINTWHCLSVYGTSIPNSIFHSSLIVLALLLGFWEFSCSLAGLLVSFSCALSSGLAPLQCLHFYTTCGLLPSPSSFWRFYSHCGNILVYYTALQLLPLKCLQLTVRS